MKPRTKKFFGDIVRHDLDYSQPISTKQAALDLLNNVEPYCPPPIKITAKNRKLANQLCEDFGIDKKLIRKKKGNYIYD